MLYRASFQIAADYFPFGSGLATFGGWISAIFYSPIYSKYGLESISGLEQGGTFITDTFWPYIIGQFGILGFFLYTWILACLIMGSLRSFRAARLPMHGILALGCLLALIEAVPESSASPIFLTPPPYYFIFGVSGMVFSLGAAKPGQGA
jgi:hypothetical protein